MQGPYPNGTSWYLEIPPTEWDWERDRLIRGERYRIIKPFVDADGDEHPIGEEWLFLRAMYSQFDDLLTLCVCFPSGDEWKIPLLWNKDKQQDIIEHWSDYMARIGEKSGQNSQSENNISN
ncbi:MAG TPA: hypothetical protein VKJ65_10070 [Phycisphaerae bacterium]|nr:hypothetical protein [Phycisphaerae bacterium]